MIVAVDTHAHIYPCHDIARLLNAASQRLGTLAARAAASRGGQPEHTRALVLCLTERSSESAYEGLRSRALLPASWSMRPTDEPAALRLTGGDGRELIVLAGQQVITSERLEVLALATTAALPDGLPLAETLARFRAAGVVPVLPWSPGKWLGARGRVVRALLESESPERLLIGDTALRPRWMPTPPLLALARTLGFRLLAGSDPLPLRGEERHVACYATVLRGDLVTPQPASALRQLLASTATPIELSGRRRSLASIACGLARHALRRG